MDRTAAKFSSHEEAEKADREYYRSLTPEQRIEILLELINLGSPEGCAGGIEKSVRIIKLSEERGSTAD